MALSAEIRPAAYCGHTEENVSWSSNAKRFELGLETGIITYRCTDLTCVETTRIRNKQS